MKENKRPILFYHHSMEKLANSIVKNGNIELGEIEWKKFPDTWSNVYIKNIDDIKMRPVIFLASLLPETLFEQISVIYALPRYQAGTFRIILPYFPVGTMERVDDEGAVATAMTLMRMLSATPASHNGGVPLLTIFDIHALQERFYMGDSIIPDLRTAIPLLKERIKNINDVAIAFPDDGACKRFGKMFNEYPHIICNKVREGKKKIVRIKEGNPRNKNVVVVDDLIMTGETANKCAVELLETGASTVFLFATHGVFPEKSWKNLTNFCRIWITDSCPWTVEAVKIKALFEILSLAPLIRGFIENEI